MGIKIVTDTGCDFSLEDAEKLGVTMLPLLVSFGDETYKDVYELDHEGFFEKLIESSALPTTSQITPFVYGEEFEKLSKNDDVICVCLSASLSGCYQSACVAAQDYDNVYVIDSESVCIGQKILIEYAFRLIDEGMSTKDIVDKLNEYKKKIKVIALLDTLEYLKKGGRISSAVAIAGTILSIKPVVGLKNGEVVLFGKARGSKSGSNMLMELVRNSGGINFDMPYELAYSGNSRRALDKYIEDSADLYEGYIDNLPVSSIGAAIGTHLGPGVIAAAFFEK